MDVVAILRSAFEYSVNKRRRSQTIRSEVADQVATSKDAEIAKLRHDLAQLKTQTKPVKDAQLPPAGADVVGGPTARNPKIHLLSASTALDKLDGKTYADSLEAVRLCFESHIESEFPRRLPQNERPCCFKLVFRDGCRPTTSGKSCPRCEGGGQKPEARAQVKAVKAVFKDLKIASSFA